MKNEYLIFEKNTNITKCGLIRNGKIIINVNAKEINGIVVSKIISQINYIRNKFKNLKIPIMFNFGEVDIKDKLTYIILEVIFHYMVKYERREISIRMVPKCRIDTEGIFDSSILHLNGKNKKDRDLFLQEFNFRLHLNHYRKVFDKRTINILDDINTFLLPFVNDDESREDISEVVSELVSNCTEHGADGQCLVDIDVANDYSKRNDKESNIYYSVNIVVINLSKYILGDQVKDKILNQNLKTERYRKVRGAYDYHRKYFNDNYMQEDFFNLVAFQDHITSRREEELTGGTGLTTLVKSLQCRSVDNYCYVLSGKRILDFKQELLEYNDEKWLGLNTSRNFINDVPEENIFCGCSMFFPGTAYNLVFVKSKE